jgi:hypothetical protein
MKNRRRRYAAPGRLIKSRAYGGAAGAAGPADAVPAPPMLRLVRPDEPPPVEPISPRRRAFDRALRLLAATAGLLAVLALVWWSATSDERAIRGLPEAQRLPLLQSTVANLKNVCDPAAPVSMREFCRRQAELAIKFRECTRDPACQQLARRHLYQPHR